MTQFEKVIKYLSIGLAIFLAVSIVIGGISVLAAIFGLGEDNILVDFYDIELSQDTERIEIDVSAASLKIVAGDRFALSTNIENLEVRSNSRLYVKQKQRRVGFHNTSAGEIILTVPANAELRSFELEAGAGSVEIEYLNTQKAELNMGAGALNIKGGVIGGLELDLGVGKTDITAALNGKAAINCGVGETNINIIGQKGDYTIDVDSGIGAITLEGMRIKNDTVIGDGKNELEIDGGVGNINIEFTSEQ